MIEVVSLKFKTQNFEKHFFVSQEKNRIDIQFKI